MATLMTAKTMSRILYSRVRCLRYMTMAHTVAIMQYRSVMPKAILVPMKLALTATDSSAKAMIAPFHQSWRFMPGRCLTQ